MFDGQRLDSSLDMLEEFVKMRCISALRGEGEIFQVGEFWEDELSGPISGSGLKL